MALEWIFYSSVSTPMNITRHPPVIVVKELLASALLPISDITPDHLENFFGAWSGSTLVSVVGIEPYNTAALLRSLAIAVPMRGAGIGSRLLIHAEQYAAEKGIHSLFLVTTSSEPYF